MVLLGKFLALSEYRMLLLQCSRQDSPSKGDEQAKGVTQ
jgi:hypothetical protein